MRVLPALAMTTALVAAAPALALPRATHATREAAILRVADLDRAPARKARAHRHHRRHAPSRGAWVVITSGHPLSRFPGEIQYRPLPGTCCCCGGW